MFLKFSHIVTAHILFFVFPADIPAFRTGTESLNSSCFPYILLEMPTFSLFGKFPPLKWLTQPLE